MTNPRPQACVVKVFGNGTTQVVECFTRKTAYSYAYWLREEINKGAPWTPANCIVVVTKWK